MRDASRPALQRFNVVGVLFLTLISTGVYQGVWFLRRRKALNALDSEARVTIVEPVILIILVLLSLVFPLGSDLQRLTSVMYGIVGLILSFRVRGMLRDHLTRHAEQLGNQRFLVNDFEPSFVWTLFFSHIYLQYKINEMIDAGDSWNERRVEPSRPDGLESAQGV